jgi:hypothetical protein
MMILNLQNSHVPFPVCRICRQVRLLVFIDCLARTMWTVVGIRFPIRFKYVCTDYTHSRYLGLMYIVQQ